MIHNKLNQTKTNQRIQNTYPMKKRINAFSNYLFYCLLVIFIINPNSLFSQDGMISFEELLKEKQYRTNVYENNEYFIDINSYHPDVYRIEISADTDIDEFASKSANFPNLQELIIVGNFMSFPTGVFKFNKLQILDISFCVADFCEGKNVITLSEEDFKELLLEWNDFISIEPSQTSIDLIV